MDPFKNCRRKHKLIHESHKDPSNLHLGVHFCQSEWHSESTLQSRKTAPVSQVLFSKFPKQTIWRYMKCKCYSCKINTLISSLETPPSKLEIYNFVPASIPDNPAALRLSSNKPFCHGKFLGLRKDWWKQTKTHSRWGKVCQQMTRK